MIVSVKTHPTDGCNERLHRPCIWFSKACALFNVQELIMSWMPNRLKYDADFATIKFFKQFNSAQVFPDILDLQPWKYNNNAKVTTMT